MMEGTRPSQPRSCSLSFLLNPTDQKENEPPEIRTSSAAIQNFNQSELNSKFENTQLPSLRPLLNLSNSNTHQTVMLFTPFLGDQMPSVPLAMTRHRPEIKISDATTGILPEMNELFDTPFENLHPWPAPAKDIHVLWNIHGLTLKLGKILSRVFDRRTLSAKDIKHLSVDASLQCLPQHFFSIADLFTLSQAQEIYFHKDSSEARRIGLLIFNHSFKQWMTDQLELQMARPADAQALYEANVFYSQHRNTPITQYFHGYLEFAITRISPFRATLSQELINCQSMIYETPFKEIWNSVQIKFISNPELLDSFSPALLFDINKHILDPSLTKISSSRAATSMKSYTVSCPGMFREPSTTPRVCEMPCETNLNRLKAFITWVKEGLQRCDQLPLDRQPATDGSNNPLVLAALTYQKLCTFRFFAEGNQRTAIIFADMILARYHILPIAWGKAGLLTIKIENAEGHASCDQTEAINALVAGLRTTYDRQL